MNSSPDKARIFLLVNLITGIFFSDLGSGGRKKINKYFYFFIFRAFFLISPETVKLVIVNQQSVLNL